MTSFRSKMRTKLGIEEEHGADAAPAEEEELSDDACKRERQVVNILRKVRNKMIQRKLEGEVGLSVAGGFRTSCCGCEVTAESTESRQDEDPEVAEKASTGMAAVDRVLNNLEKKAFRIWSGVDFHEDSTIGTEVSFGITLGPFGISFTVSIDASVPSLIEAYKRRHES